MSVRYRAPRQFPINPPYAQYFAMKKAQTGTKKVVAHTLIPEAEAGDTSTAAHDA